MKKATRSWLLKLQCFYPTNKRLRKYVTINYIFPFAIIFLMLLTSIHSVLKQFPDISDTSVTSPENKTVIWKWGNHVLFNINQKTWQTIHKIVWRYPEFAISLYIFRKCDFKKSINVEFSRDLYLLYTSTWKCKLWYVHKLCNAVINGV